jgi:hypothetical protein
MFSTDKGPDRPAGYPWLARLRKQGAVVISASTIVALSVCPIPLCFDCEFPNPWGHVQARCEAPLAVWLLFAPFAAGILGLRRSWLVPVCVVLGFLATQPLGGVEWWSLRDNEGPFILMYCAPLALACFGAGHLIRLAAILARRFLAVGAR